MSNENSSAYLELRWGTPSPLTPTTIGDGNGDFDGLLPGGWDVFVYNATSEQPLSQNQHILLVAFNDTEIDRTTEDPPGADDTYGNPSITTSDATATLIATQTLGWELSHHNIPETWLSGTVTIKYWDVEITADGGWAKGVPTAGAGQFNIYTAGIYAGWHAPRLPADPLTYESLTVLATPDGSVTNVGPVDVQNVALSWSADVDDLALISGAWDVAPTNGNTTNYDPLLATFIEGFGAGWWKFDVSSAFSFDVNINNTGHQQSAAGAAALILRHP